MWNYRSIYEYHKYIKPDIVSWIVKSYDIKLLRDKVKYISNESYFFSDTIKNNITCGKKDISNKTLETQVLIYNNLLKNENISVILISNNVIDDLSFDDTIYINKGRVKQYSMVQWYNEQK